MLRSVRRSARAVLDDPRLLLYARNWVEGSVRERLKIPFNPSRASIRYEHSMGQGVNALPEFVLRSTPLPASD